MDEDTVIRAATARVIENMTALQERRGMNDADVRRAGFLKQSAITDLRRSVRSPQLATVAKIAHGLDVDPAVLLMPPSLRDIGGAALDLLKRASTSDLPRILAVLRAFGREPEVVEGTAEPVQFKTTSPVAPSATAREPAAEISEIERLSGHDMVKAPAHIRQSWKVAETLGEGHQIHAARLKSESLVSLGYMRGDMVLVDYREPTAAHAGDIVVAQVNERPTGEWDTVLRRLDPPFLMPASPDPRHRPHTLGPHTQLRGIVVASWRVRGPEPELLEAEPAEAG